MRVIADTNTVVSAFLWGGPPAAVLAAARAGYITLFTSPVLLAELEDVLSREKFAARIVRVGSSAAQMLAGYRALVTSCVRPRLNPPPVIPTMITCSLAQRPHKLSSSSRATRISSIYASIRASPSSPPLRPCNA